MVLLIGAFTLVYGSLMASRKLHNKIINSLLKAPVWWYDTVSIGEICCRLGQDLSTIDKTFAERTRELLFCLTKFFGSVVILLKTIPVVVPILIPLFIILNMIHVR